MRQTLALVVLGCAIAASLASGRPAVSAPPPFPAVVNVAILAGDGRVTSVPSGIDCPTTCTASFISGSTVTLTAEPGTGAALYTWGGACSGEQAVCKLIPEDETDITATFDPARLTVAAQGSGGWVTSAAVDSPEGIDCPVGSTCTATFPVGTIVRLYGIRTPEGALDSYGGCTSWSTVICTVALTTDMS